MNSKTPLGETEKYWFIYGYCYRMAEELQQNGIYDGIDIKDVIKILIEDTIYKND